MSKKLEDIRKPFKCEQCAKATHKASDYLFDPNTTVQLKKLETVTLGYQRHHFHEFRAPGETVFGHFFDVYQLTHRGLLEIWSSEWSRYLDAAVRYALLLTPYPTEKDYKRHGL